MGLGRSVRLFGVSLVGVLMLSGVMPARAGQTAIVDLFNGSDLGNWNGSGWRVSQGRLVSTTGDTPLSWGPWLLGKDYSISMRLRVNQGMRPRVLLDGTGIYFGNEGSGRQFEVYGSYLSGIKQIGDDSYLPGTWYDLRLDVSGRDVRFYKNGSLTHTAHLDKVLPVRVEMHQGDAWSPGQVDVASMSYTATLPDPIYNPANGHWYQVVGGDWHAAESRAIELGGHLVSINNKAENDWLMAHFGDGYPYWIGLTQASGKGWRWSSGEALTYANWYPGEPNDANGVEHWGIFNWSNWSDTGGRWADANAQMMYFGIAEYAVVPEPAMLPMIVLGAGLLVEARRRRRGGDGKAS
ncbi:MAG: lectin-like protein [Bacillota bacterium]